MLETDDNEEVKVVGTGVDEKVKALGTGVDEKVKAMGTGIDKKVEALGAERQGGGQDAGGPALTRTSRCWGPSAD